VVSRRMDWLRSSGLELDLRVGWSPPELASDIRGRPEDADLAH